MRTRTLVPLAVAAAIVAAGTGYLLARSHDAAETTLAELATRTHFHGIAVDRADPERIYLATHHGLYVAAPDGMARRVSDHRDDLMGFTPHPAEPGVLYASGHPETGGNLGVIRSEDGGRAWTQIALGFDGPVDFHQMDVSAADPDVMYGVYGTLQASRDGGNSWQAIGPPPDGLIDLAASALDPEVLYAATRDGLLRSSDGGRSFEPAHMLQRPATMVRVGPDGAVYAFMLGVGLIRTEEPQLRWRTVSEDFGGAYVLHLAVDPHDPELLYAVTLDPATHAQAVVISEDGGQTWRALGGS